MTVFITDYLVFMAWIRGHGIQLRSSIDGVLSREHGVVGRQEIITNKCVLFTDFQLKLLKCLLFPDLQLKILKTMATDHLMVDYCKL